MPPLLNADPKPEKRAVASKPEWDAILAAKLVGQPCRGGCNLPPWSLHAHHLVPRAQRGGDDKANIVGLCFACHMAWHEHSQDWQRVASSIRASLLPAEVDYIETHKGRDWLDKHYPVESPHGLTCERCGKRPAETLHGGEWICPACDMWEAA